MAVPDYQSLMLPLLKFAAESQYEISTNEAVEVLAKKLNLTEEDLREMLPSGTQFTFARGLGSSGTIRYAKPSRNLDGRLKASQNRAFDDEIERAQQVCDR